MIAEPGRQGERNGDLITDFKYAGGKGDVYQEGTGWDLD